MLLLMYFVILIYFFSLFPPAVVTDGEAADFAAAPGRLLDAFSVPVVSASAFPGPGQHLISTATDTATLATVRYRAFWEFVALISHFNCLSL